MSRDANHEYTELTDMTNAPGGAAAERTYETSTQPNASGRRGLKVLMRDPEFRKNFLLSALFIILWYSFSGMLSVYNRWLFGNSERDFSFPLF
ncbi:hypothetical protein FBU59_007268, partial [Linderina macrospora]